MTDTRLPAPDPEKVRTILSRISSSSAMPLASRGRFRESMASARFRHASDFSRGLKDVWEEFRRVDRRATVACAEIAAKYSPEAAAEILSRPDLEPWSG